MEIDKWHVMLFPLLNIIEICSSWLTKWHPSHIMDRLSLHDENQMMMYFLTCLHIALWVPSVNATALFSVLDKWCDAILECSPLIVKCLLIILWFRAQRTQLLESIPHFPGEIEKKMSHIRTFFALKALLMLPFSFRTVLPTVSEKAVSLPAVSVNQWNPFAAVE